MANDQVIDAIRHNRNVPKALPNAKQNCRPEPILDPVIVFFIGGAGDKERYYLTGPYNNIVEAKRVLDPKLQDLLRCQLYKSIYCGYNEVRGEDKIADHVIKEIPSRKSKIYIVGHSLGGWNGAHLSTILSSRGYIVEMLITLDPVGEGKFVWAGSNIHREKPIPEAKFWINIRANPSNPDASDFIADIGERWNVKSGPTLNYIANINHYNAKKLFTVPLRERKSAAEILYDAIRKVTAQ